MNTENVIEYIRRSSALVWKKSFFIMELIYMPLMSIGFMMIGKMVGRFCYASGIGAVITCVVHLVALIILFRKTSPIKNKFIINFTSSCNTIFILAFFYTVMHYELNLPEKNIIASIVLLVFIPLFLSVLYSRLLKRTEFAFRSKRKIAYTSISYWVSGTAAAGRFLFGLVLKEYGSLFGERALYLVIMYVFLFSMLFMSINSLDLQRYYYFTKLEKEGLVSEDILKPDEEYKA